MAKSKTDQTSSMLGDDDAPPILPHPATAEGSGTPPASEPAPQPDGRPYCARHNCLMKAASSPERVTYYACPVPGCDQSAKRLRPQSKIPSEPQQCPSAICAKRSEPSYLEVDPKRSQLAKLWMECPHCGFSVQQPRPAFQPHQRAADEDLSAR